jgi:hypothetical protein
MQIIISKSIQRQNHYEIYGWGEKNAEDENERGKNFIVPDEKISS